ncbi:MAG: serine/threonine-protein kinase [Myxococcota bacterium]
MEHTREKLGKYTLVRHIATGGMAEIWLAEQDGPGGFSKQLVIKRILPMMASDGHFIEMFLDEARTVAQLTHPNIGQVFDLGEIDGSYFIAMEYIDGMDLSDLISTAAEAGTFLPIEIAVRMTIDTLHALGFAHNFVDRDGQFANLVHRDVTPHNVLVSNDGVVKLVDFGVAKAKANTSKTETGAVKGKYAYMAPEQVTGGDIDRRVDVFAAGILLFELLTNQRPFGDDLIAVHNILNHPTPDPRAQRAEVPQSIVNILNIALAKSPEERYESADSMAFDLEEFMRAHGLYASPKDVAAYVRAAQGIAPALIAHTSTSGPRARITEREGALLDRTERPTEPPLEGAPLTPLRTTPIPPEAQTSAEEVGVVEEQPRSTKPLIAAFGAVVLLIVVMGVVAVSMLIGPRGDDSAKPLALEEAEVAEVLDARPADPSKLFHKDGGLVMLVAEDPMDIYVDGDLIGTTPHRTSLRPGTYIVEVAKGDAPKKKVALEVVAKMGIQRVAVNPKQ